MKIKHILLVTLTILCFSTCDKIESPYRENVVVADFCQTGIEDTIVHKKVLVEDYTGHLCGNCPDAGYYLNDTLKSIYNHCLVVISVHAGFFAEVCPNPPCPGNQPAGSFLTDFRSNVGTAWNTFFQVIAWPNGMVDRIDYPSTNVKLYTEWASAIATEIAKPAQAKLKITNTYNSVSNSVNVSVKSDFIDNLPGDYKLQVVITEDSIIDWQEWYHPSPTVIFIPDYVHHHVLRDALNTNFGEVLVTGGASNGTSITKNYSYTINNSWNVNHCNIVAFIYDAANYEVLQVEEAAVK